jgi:hypothetical protein
MNLTLVTGKLSAVIVGIPVGPVFTKIVTAAPTAAALRGPPAFRASVPTPAGITFDPVILAQTLAIALGIVIFLPFPGILFNRTLEENYAEVAGGVRRVRRRLRSMFALPFLRASRPVRRPPEYPAPMASSPGSEGERDALPTDPEVNPVTGGDLWRTPLGIVLFLLLSALLYCFLDPTFGPDLQSLATFAGLATGLVATLIAFSVPIAVAYRRSRVPFSVRALPATLALGLVCVLITRLTNFQPGYLYGLVIAFVVAHGLGVTIEGKAMAQAAATALVLAVVAWFALWWVDTLIAAQGDPQTVLIAVQTALVTALVAGVELAVFGMIPLRFLPGEKIFRWNRRIWAVLLGIALFGFLHILLNPRSGYLADATRTPMVTIVALLFFFGVGSFAFWAYFRFRRAPVALLAASVTR